MKLTKTEMNEMVKFWQRYMVARKTYEDFQRKQGNQLDYAVWLDYIEAKMDAFKKLRLTIPEINYTDFWRDVTGLRPEAVVDGILFYRRRQDALKKQRADEKSIIAGQKLLMQ